MKSERERQKRVELGKLLVEAIVSVLLLICIKFIWPETLIETVFETISIVLIYFVGRKTGEIVENTDWEQWLKSVDEEQKTRKRYGKII